jgi:hypothetical protein
MRPHAAGITLIIGAIAVFGVAGCDADDTAERLAEEAGGSDIDLELGDLPDGFPKDDVPLPEGDIVSGTSLGTGSEQTWTVVLRVGEVEPATDDYRGELEDAGFEIQDTFSSETAPGQEVSGELVSFIGTSSDYVVNVFGGGEGGEDVLSITVSRALTEVP